MTPVQPTGHPRDHFRESLHRWFNTVCQYGLWSRELGSESMVLIHWMTYP